MPDVFGVGKGEQLLEDAAARALLLLSRQPNINEQEFMTILFRDPRDGLIYRAPFQTQRLRNRSQFTGTVFGDVLGTVHNHPLQRHSDQISTSRFSVTDAAQGQQTQNVGFLLAPQREGLPAERRLPPIAEGVRVSSPAVIKHGIVGEEFLAQIPIDLMLQLMARDNPLLASFLQRRGDVPNVAQARPATELPPPESGGRPKRITGSNNGNPNTR